VFGPPPLLVYHPKYRGGNTAGIYARWPYLCRWGALLAGSELPRTPSMRSSSHALRYGPTLRRFTRFSSPHHRLGVSLARVPHVPRGSRLSGTRPRAPPGPHRRTTVGASGGICGAPAVLWWGVYTLGVHTLASEGPSSEAWLRPVYVGGAPSAGPGLAKTRPKRVVPRRARLTRTARAVREPGWTSALIEPKSRGSPSASARTSEHSPSTHFGE
jgi:hypothetical protein